MGFVVGLLAAFGCAVSEGEPVAQLASPDELTDEALRAIADRPIAYREMARSYVVGRYHGTPVRMSVLCTDVRLLGAWRVVEYDVELTDCARAGGVAALRDHPWGIGVAREPVCVPPLLAEDGPKGRAQPDKQPPKVKLGTGEPAGAPCDGEGDCARGLECYFALHSGCAARGRCESPAEHECRKDGPFATVCLCEGEPVVLQCANATEMIVPSAVDGPPCRRLGSR